ncbi:DUF6338 family protein [Microbacterium sp. DT81.1]|uniref:DUF6338 family protein n=1 Tax=Microbacterium sp. DT81.1 TaxID=3393413 RepID=UPI003CEABACA
MTVPDSFPQVLIFIAMLVPGFSFVAVRTWYVGWRSPDYGAGSRILEALYVSAIFLVLYAGLLAVGFGVVALWTGVGTLSALQAWLVDGWKGAPAGWLALLAIVLLVVIPGVVSALMVRRKSKVIVGEDGSRKVVKTTVNRNQATPRAWDHAAYGAEDACFVRVLSHTGVYVGGWYGEGSYSSTYPYEKDIFIAHQWRMSKKGEFLEPLANSLGVWVPLTESCQVEWIAVNENEGSNEGRKWWQKISRGEARA